jgi:Tol biopolymer transport system component
MRSSMLLIVTIVALTFTESSYGQPESYIAFESSRDGKTHIYRMDPDGSNQFALTSSEGWEVGPSWSPDGTKILYGSSVTWEHFVMEPDGGNPVPLSDLPPVSSHGPGVWSPDDTRIIIISYDGVISVGLDGSDPVNIEERLGLVGLDGFPTWSPDSARVAFSTTRDDPDGRRGEIYVVNVDGSDPVNITNNPESFDERPAWSPDGSRIAFHSLRESDWEIYVMDPDGSNPVNLTNSIGRDLMPTWSPDGAKIAFQSFRDGNSEIFVMNADGSNPVNITNNPATDSVPKWSPFMGTAPTLVEVLSWGWIKAGVR